MPRATTNTGALTSTGCTLTVGEIVIQLKILPDVSDSKSATYNDEPVIGRSFPIKTYAYSDNRTISLTTYWYADSQQVCINNLYYMRVIQSATYPREGDNATSLPFKPPPICKLYGINMLSLSPLCVVLKRYSTKIPRDAPWDQNVRIPYYFSMDLEFDVVYNYSDLPGQERILKDVYAVAREQ